MKILICGLPGAGKTWLAERLVKHIDNCAWYNADVIRGAANDWDFSPEGRMRQANRMKTFADFEVSNGRSVICDFVAPTKETRDQFNPKLVIWVDTLEKGRFEDTNKMFQPPNNVDLHITEHVLESNVAAIAHDIVRKFDWKKPTVQMLGRWQPWHDGHTALFKRCHDKTQQVMIQVRDVQGVDDNPFNFDTVCSNIQTGLSEHGFVRDVDYDIMLVPNIVNITYGRGVGYAIEQEVFDDAVHDISATAIRKQMRDQGKL